MLSSFSQKGMIEGEHMQEWFDSVEICPCVRGGRQMETLF